MTNTFTNNKLKDKTQKLRRVRMHISNTKWLNYDVYLKNGIVILRDRAGIELELSSSLLSKTQRSIYQIRKSSSLAKELFNNPEIWLNEKLAQLETFKILNNLSINKLQNTIKQAPSKKSKANAPSLSLLEIESISINNTSISITDYLLKYSSDLEIPLTDYIFEYNHTEHSKALACLVLGCINKTSGTTLSASLKRRIQSTWLKDCYSFGIKNGLPQYPVLTTLFLRSGSSASDIKYLNKVQNPDIQFPLSQATTRILLNRGMAPKEIVQLLKSCFPLRASIDLLKPIDNILPKGKTKKDKLKRQDLEQKHKKLFTQFESNISRFIEESNTEEAPLQIAELINAIVEIESDNISNLKELNYVLELGLSANSGIRSTWIKLVIDKVSIMWITNKQKEKTCVSLSRRTEYPKRTFLNSSLELLELVQDYDTVSDIIEFFMPAVVLNSGIKDIDLLKQAMYWCNKMQVNRTYFMGHFLKVVKLAKTKENAQKKLGKLVDIISEIPRDHRDHAQYVLFEKLHSIDKLNSSLKPFIEILPNFLQATIEDNSSTCPCHTLMYSALKINSSDSTNKLELLNTLIEFYKNNYGISYSNLPLIEYNTVISLSLINYLKKGLLSQEYLNCKKIALNDCKLFSYLLRNNVSGFDIDNSDFIESGIQEIIKKPEFLILLIDKFRTHPKLVWDHISNIGIISKFSPKVRSRFDKLKRFNEIEVSTKSTKTLVSKGWKEIAIRVPELKPLILSFICTKSITGETQTPPGSLLKVLNLKEKLIQEKEYLESFSKEGDRSRSIDIRVRNLVKRIEDQEEIDKTISLQLRRHIFHITKQAELDAINFVIKDAFKYQLKKITGEAPDQIVFDSYMRNALLLTQDIDENKRLLKRLIRATVSKDTNFRYELVGNQNFLSKLENEWHINKDIWLSVNPQTFSANEIPGRKVHLKLENDPLKILEMGNYFDTCLSFGGENSFSTVTNACDLNKRVVYAFNSGGVVIGRKLIGISESGKLVGFRTYSSVETKEGRLELRKLLNMYIKEFAENCGLTLANQGTVVPLSSAQWYDDGIVKWSAEPQKVEKSSGSQKSVHKS